MCTSYRMSLLPNLNKLKSKLTKTDLLMFQKKLIVLISETNLIHNGTIHKTRVLPLRSNKPENREIHFA